MKQQAVEDGGDGFWFVDKGHKYQLAVALKPYFDRADRISDKYYFGEVVGHGSLSEVFLAVHRHLNVIVAIKRISRNKISSRKQQREIFREFELLERLNHPNIVQFIDIFIDQKNFYIITE